ncbi:MAG TPA: hypothetical protein PK297_00100 [Spirochaetota bacterium]|mgnify:FL=1|nr:hypothetical protein [Spirochaetota bacterium]
MSKKNVLRLFSVLALLVLSVPAFVQSQELTREVRIQLTDVAEISTADLYIDGVQRGYVRKGVANTVHLSIGQHTISLRAVVNGVEYKREKTEQIVSGVTPQFIFLHPGKQTGTNSTGSATVLVILDSNSPVKMANVRINGVSKGDITRGDSGKRFSVPADTDITITLYREWNGRVYEAEKKVKIRAGQTITVRLLPTKQ